MTQTSDQVFVVTARSGNERPTQFLIEAPNHRDAWRIARQACREGRGAFVRDPQSNQLVAYPLTPGELTVARVLSTSTHRRGRPPKITADDVLAVFQERGVTQNRKLKKVLESIA